MQEELRLCVSKAQKCETSKPQKVSVSVPRKAFTVHKIAIRTSGLKSVTSSPTVPTAHTDPASTNTPQLVENVTQVNPTQKPIVPATSDTPATTTNIVPEPSKAEQSQVTDNIEPDGKITPSEPSTQENKQVKPENPIKEKAPKGTTEMKDTDGMKPQTQETQGEKIAKEHKKKSTAQNKHKEHKSLPKKHKKRIVSSSSASSSSSSSDKESSSSSTEKKRKGHHYKPKRSKKEEKTNSESSSSSKRKKHKLTSSTKELPTQTDTDADRKESKSKKSRKNKEAKPGSKPKPVKSSLQASNLDAQEEKNPAVQEDKSEQSIETIMQPNQLPTQPEQPPDAKTPPFPSDQPVRRKCGRPKNTRKAVDTTEQSSSLLKDEGSQENNTQEVTVPARKRRKIMASNATPVAELTEQTTNLPIATSTESTKEPILTEERSSKLELQAIPDETKDDSLQPESQLKSKKRKRLSEAERLKKSLADDVPPYAPKPLVEISSLLGPSLATRARHKIVDSDTIKGEVATTKPKSSEEQVVIRQARIPWTKRRKIPYV